MDAQTSEQALEAQLEMLRSASSEISAKRVLRGIVSQAHQERRHVIFAVIGAAVAAVGTVHFAVLSDPFGYWALSLTTFAMAFAAWRSANRATRLMTVKSGASLLGSWRAELETQLRHTLLAPFISLGFAAMAVWVAASHGSTSAKGASFLIVTAALLAFSGHQHLVVRPQLKRELRLFHPNE